jgi:pyruvate formate lyase activating enzyme
MKCPVCFRHCDLQDGQTGFCKARIGKEGKVVAANYGLLTSLALDPIEKKPLREFYPGSLVLSCGSYGCNLRCPFCQNFEISQYNRAEEARFYSSEELVEVALSCQKEGNIGLAFTYNEPMVGYEYVRDAAKLAKEKGLKTILVTNGCASVEVLKEVLPYLDAMNIDLKGFSEEYFHYVDGDFEMTKAFIALAQTASHVELTTLVVPHHTDDPKMMEQEAKWIASLNPKIPLHLTRYFPRYKEKEAPTSLQSLQELEAVAQRYLTSVYLGNI